MRIESQIKNTVILTEECAFEGVRRIADTVSKDIALVTGADVRCISSLEELSGMQGISQIILCATAGHSALLERLSASGCVELSDLYRDGKPKREVYGIRLVKQPFEDIAEALVIFGSDKRGTIYGMFALSEYIGVTPLIFWGDAAPARKGYIEIGKDIQTTPVSKEPSVRYRGFFVNDEWPCFGNWVCRHYGGFNAEAYRIVFEFLLRLKGNYLWPAMWTASFPLDGPASKNEELANLYGVVMGYSHHEPCLRASEEWDKVKGADTAYGCGWNFYTNEEGLLNYWRDALMRSGKYENIITIGMRGERDSSMLGEDASVGENINLLKRIIKAQRQLIRECVDENLENVPQLLALYKEVEQYFYGDKENVGLKDWEELDGVICMLCEDNFGQMRTLPIEEVRNRKGGWGMYYHLDYHGGPVSYEWVDSTPLSKIWEQMSMAYEYGIRDVWIVNVGDVKFHEVPLTYFMSLAYDYERWGEKNPHSYEEYVKQWVHAVFSQVSDDLQTKIGQVLTDYIMINSIRRPEALHAEVYHPCHYTETDRMLHRALQVERMSAEVMEALSENDKTGYYSMIHYPASASVNLLKMHLYAGKNHHYARQGKPVANRYGELARECMETDRKLAEEFAGFQNGKWDGMQLAQHIGFTKWNEDDYRYPVLCHVEPAHRLRLAVSRKDSERTAGKSYGMMEKIAVPDFLYAGCSEVILEVANTGLGVLHYDISVQNEMELPGWLTVTPLSGDVDLQQDIVISCDRRKLPEKVEQICLVIAAEDTEIAVEIQAKAAEKEAREIAAADAQKTISAASGRVFLTGRYGIVMKAEHYYSKKDIGTAAYRVMQGYGKYGSGVKVFPSTASFTAESDKPALTYCFLIPESGEYQVRLHTAPTNSVQKGKAVGILVQNHYMELVAADFRAGECNDADWCRGVLNQEHINEESIYFEKGVQTLEIGALEAGVVLEQIHIYPKGTYLPEGYLGSEESAYL